MKILQADGKKVGLSKVLPIEIIFCEDSVNGCLPRELRAKIKKKKQRCFSMRKKIKRNEAANARRADSGLGKWTNPITKYVHDKTKERSE